MECPGCTKKPYVGNVWNYFVTYFRRDPRVRKLYVVSVCVDYRQFQWMYDDLNVPMIRSVGEHDLWREFRFSRELVGIFLVLPN